MAGNDSYLHKCWNAVCEKGLKEDSPVYSTFENWLDKGNSLSWNEIDAPRKSEILEVLDASFPLKADDDAGKLIQDEIKAVFDTEPDEEAISLNLLIANRYLMYLQSHGLEKMYCWLNKIVQDLLKNAEKPSKVIRFLAGLYALPDFEGLVIALQSEQKDKFEKIIYSQVKQFLDNNGGIDSNYYREIKETRLGMVYLIDWKRHPDDALYLLKNASKIICAVASVALLIVVVIFLSKDHTSTSGSTTEMSSTESSICVFKPVYEVDSSSSDTESVTSDFPGYPDAEGTKGDKQENTSDKNDSKMPSSLKFPDDLITKESSSNETVVNDSIQTDSLSESTMDITKPQEKGGTRIKSSHVLEQERNLRYDTFLDDKMIQRDQNNNRLVVPMGKEVLFQWKFDNIETEEEGTWYYISYYDEEDGVNRQGYIFYTGNVEETE